MCGIAGFIRLDNCETPDPVVRRIALGLMRQIAERGDRATGYAYVSGGGLKVVKDKVGVEEFIERYERTIDQDIYEARAWIAHSRMPSSGSVERPANNHPIFSKGGLAIVHNGIIYNADEVYEHFKLERDGEVDSEVILKLIEHQRPTTAHIGEAITEAVKYLDGSLTFALIDGARPSEVWLHKWGYGSPVSIVVLSGLVVFASELEYVLSSIGKKSKGFVRLPTLKARTLEDGELVRICPRGFEFSKTDPESEAIPSKRLLNSDDPDDPYSPYQMGFDDPNYPYQTGRSWWR